MRRLTVLMIEVEQPEGLSARKLMVESAKQNVLTAYDGEEGLELFERSAVHLVVIHSRLRNPSAQEVVDAIRARSATIPIVGITPNGSRLGGVTEMISSYDPAQLMSLVKKYSKAILGHE